MQCDWEFRHPPATDCTNIACARRWAGAQRWDVRGRMSGNENGARTAPKAWTSHAARMLGMSESVVLVLIGVASRLVTSCLEKPPADVGRCGSLALAIGELIAAFGEPSTPSPTATRRRRSGGGRVPASRPLIGSSLLRECGAVVQISVPQVIVTSPPGTPHFEVSRVRWRPIKPPPQDRRIATGCPGSIPHDSGARHPEHDSLASLSAWP